MTFRARIVAGVTVLSALVFAIAGVITVFSLEKQLVEEVDFEISVRVGWAMDSLGRIPFGRLGPVVGEGIDQMFHKRDVAVMLVPVEGQVTVIPAGSFEDPDPLPDISTDSLSVADPFTVDAVEGDFRYRVAVHEVPGGHVVLAASLEKVESAVAALAVNVSLIGAGAVLVAGLRTAAIVRRGMRPVDEMIFTAEKVGDGTLSERVKDTDPNTEVGHLAIDINNMLTRVEEAMAIREASEMVFERFTRPSPAGEGSGLGLAIVRSIVEAHGGTVRIDGTGGTTVVVEFDVEA